MACRTLSVSQSGRLVRGQRRRQFLFGTACIKSASALVKLAAPGMAPLKCPRRTTTRSCDGMISVGLASRACHIICVPRYRKPTVTVDPEEAAVDWALVGLPCGRRCTYELGVSFGENPLTVPNAVLKI